MYRDRDSRERRERPSLNVFRYYTTIPVYWLSCKIILDPAPVSTRAE